MIMPKTMMAMAIMMVPMIKCGDASPAELGGGRHLLHRCMGEGPRGGGLYFELGAFLTSPALELARSFLPACSISEGCEERQGKCRQVSKYVSKCARARKRTYWSLRWASLSMWA